MIYNKNCRTDSFLVKFYLDDIKKLIAYDNYQIELNDNRQKNINFFNDYLISEKDAKEILLNLTEKDFVKFTPNKSPNFPEQMLCVFNKKLSLVARYEDIEKDVIIYIKTRQVYDAVSGETTKVVIVSFHD